MRRLDYYFYDWEEVLAFFNKESRWYDEYYDTGRTLQGTDLHSETIGKW